MGFLVSFLSEASLHEREPPLHSPGSVLLLGISFLEEPQHSLTLNSLEKGAERIPGCKLRDMLGPHPEQFY